MVSGASSCSISEVCPAALTAASGPCPAQMFAFLPDTAVSPSREGVPPPVCAPKRKAEMYLHIHYFEMNALGRWDGRNCWAN